MLRYLREAFWASPPTPGLGNIPWNVVAVAGTTLLGFGHPAFWLLGAAAETAYLAGLVFHPRFQKWVDSKKFALEEGRSAQQRQALVQRLFPECRARLVRLENQCESVLQVRAASTGEDDVGDGEILLENDRDALERLKWIFLKLLVAQTNLQSANPRSDEAALVRQIDTLENELLAGASFSVALRESKEATLRIARQRLEASKRRQQSLMEIESDLVRIESQVELARDQASLHGRQEALSANISLASSLLGDSIYGDSIGDISALDRTYAAPAAAKVAEQ